MPGDGLLLLWLAAADGEAAGDGLLLLLLDVLAPVGDAEVGLVDVVVLAADEFMAFLVAAPATPGAAALVADSDDGNGGGGVKCGLLERAPLETWGWWMWRTRDVRMKGVQ